MNVCVCVSEREEGGGREGGKEIVRGREKGIKDGRGRGREENYISGMACFFSHSNIPWTSFLNRTYKAKSCLIILKGCITFHFG